MVLGARCKTRKGAPKEGLEASQVGERCALRVDMSATCNPSSALGEQMSTSGAVRRGIVARMAEFIEASMMK